MKPEELLKLAVEAMDHAYVPYSGYRVGAALLCADGTVYQGCNIENASYTPTICAERHAFFQAVYHGKREFTAIAVVGGKDGVITGLFPPCGVCRQVCGNSAGMTSASIWAAWVKPTRSTPWRSCCPSASPPSGI